MGTTQILYIGFLLPGQIGLKLQVNPTNGDNFSTLSEVLLVQGLSSAF